MCVCVCLCVYVCVCDHTRCCRTRCLHTDEESSLPTLYSCTATSYRPQHCTFGGLSLRCCSPQRSRRQRFQSIRLPHMHMASANPMPAMTQRRSMCTCNCEQHHPAHAIDSGTPTCPRVANGCNCMSLSTPTARHCVGIWHACDTRRILCSLEVGMAWCGNDDTTVLAAV